MTSPEQNTGKKLEEKIFCPLVRVTQRGYKYCFKNGVCRYRGIEGSCADYRAYITLKNSKERYELKEGEELHER